MSKGDSLTTFFKSVIKSPTKKEKPMALYLTLNNKPTASSNQDSQVNHEEKLLQNTTDEDDWQTNSRKRGRKDSPESSLQVTKQTKLKDYWLSAPIKTNNRFENLNEESNENEHVENTNEQNEKSPKPPPIFIAGVVNINPLIQLLNDIAKENYEIKITDNDKVKIQPKTSEKYGEITKALADKGTEFHTYQPRQERNFRVVLKNIHYSTDTRDITREIENYGHTVVNIHNIKQRTTKKPLSLFFVDLTPASNNKEIYSLTRLLSSVIKFEPPLQKKEIPQCARCQRYGHTKNFCYRTPRCVKCAEDHLSTQCPKKERSKDVKCVLCNGNHPANYRGCLVHKELQQQKFPPLRERSSANTIPQTNLPSSSIRNPEVSYAEMAKTQSQQLQATNINNPVPQEVTQQSNDISELKQMMKGLMEQMGTMLNLLTTVISKLA